MKQYFQRTKPQLNWNDKIVYFEWLVHNNQLIGDRDMHQCYGWHYLNQSYLTGGCQNVQSWYKHFYHLQMKFGAS